NAPHDWVSRELDGVSLVEGAEDEPLLPLVESLLICTGALARGTAMADISLPESGLVLCIENTEDGCTLRIASLARPARLVRRVRLDWGGGGGGGGGMGGQVICGLGRSALPPGGPGGDPGPPPAPPPPPPPPPRPPPPPLRP